MPVRTWRWWSSPKLCDQVQWNGFVPPLLSGLVLLPFLRNSDGGLNFIRIWHKSVVCPNGPFTMTELACFCQSGPPQTAGSIVELGWVGLGTLTTSAGAMVDWFPVCGGGLGTLITAMVDWPPRVQFMISQVPPNVRLSTKSHSGLDWNICPPTFTFHKPWWMMNKMILWTQWMMSMLNINGEWMSEWREEFSFSFINLDKEGEKWNLIVDLSQYVVGLNIVTGWRWWGLLKIYAKR